MLRARDIPGPYLRRAGTFTWGTIFCSRNSLRGRRAFRKAKELGLTTSLDCNSRSERKMELRLRDVLKHVDIFFPE